MRGDDRNLRLELLSYHALKESMFTNCGNVVAQKETNFETRAAHAECKRGMNETRP